MKFLWACASILSSIPQTRSKNVTGSINQSRLRKLQI